MMGVGLVYGALFVTGNIFFLPLFFFTGFL